MRLKGIPFTLAAEDIEETIAKAFVEAAVNDWIDCRVAVSDERCKIGCTLEPGGQLEATRVDDQIFDRWGDRDQKSDGTRETKTRVRKSAPSFRFLCLFISPKEAILHSRPRGKTIREM